MGNPIKKTSICLITPGHLCNCPRLMKEALALDKEGYQIHIICSAYMPYLIAHDQMIADQHPQWHIISKNWQAYTFNGFLNKIKHFLIRLLFLLWPSPKLYPYLLNRNFKWQLRQAKKLKSQLYIAHSAGSIAIAAIAAKKVGSTFSFDAEDFHTGEDLSYKTIEMIHAIQHQYLPRAKYLTAASQPIALAYEKLLLKNAIPTILNVFPKTKSAFQSNKSETLKLVWFSQTVGLNRGLKGILIGINEVQIGPIQLDIIGAYSKEVVLTLESMLTNNLHQVNFLGYLHDEELKFKLRTYDIGIASETGKDLNNNLALSNKIFSYITAGLALLVSDTDAQKHFMKHLNVEIGLLYENKNVSTITQSIHQWLNNPTLLMGHQKNAYHLGLEALNWETEQIKFISIVSECLNEK
jgi:glycosyltransferase involved in cell wall biosynthesis